MDTTEIVDLLVKVINDKRCSVGAGGIRSGWDWAWEIIERAFVQPAVGALLESPVHDMQLPPPEGAVSGVYALYYMGALGRYASITSPEAWVPIYVGKSLNLHNRWRTHRQSLEQASDLDPSEFLIRTYPFPSRAIGVLEEAVIAHFQPIPHWCREWYAGFGNDGRPSREDKKTGIRRASCWDCIHTGRLRASEVPAEEVRKEIIEWSSAMDRRLEGELAQAMEIPAGRKVTPGTDVQGSTIFDVV